MPYGGALGLLTRFVTVWPHVDHLEAHITTLHSFLVGVSTHMQRTGTVRQDCLIYIQRVYLMYTLTTQAKDCKLQHARRYPRVAINVYRLVEH